MNDLSFKIIFFRLTRLMSFFFTARGKRYVHSPFLFPLYQSMRTASLNEIKAFQSLYRERCRDANILNFQEVGSRTNTIRTTVGVLSRRTGHNPASRIKILALARSFGATNILELGSGTGMTSLLFSKINNKINVISVEGVEQIALAARNLMKEQKVPNVLIENGMFEYVLKQFEVDSKHFNFVLIDGSHEKKATLNLINLIYPILENCSIVIIDDLHYSPSMAAAWEILSFDNRFEVKWEFYRYGVLIKNKNLSPSVMRLR